MVMGESADPVDFLVIGGGPGGYTAALHAARLGRDVTLIERGAIGGVCLNVGCIPSKALIEAADAHQTVLRALGNSADQVVDLDTWQQRKVEIVDFLSRGVSGQLKTAGVRVMTGTARFTGRNRVAVQVSPEETAFIEFRHAIIATGSRPATIPTTPIDGDQVLDSSGALALETLPKHLVVVGAGYIGVELATAFAKLGSTVTIVELGERVLPEMPPQFARPVAKRLKELNVDVHTGASFQGLTDGAALIHSPAGTISATADLVLIAVGRIPNTDDLGLEAAMVRTNATGRIPVGPDRVISGTDIAAIGDVTDGPMLAHKATSEALVAAEALCGKPSAFEPVTIPLVVFSDPEIASAGHTEDSATEAGISVRTVTTPLAALGRAATLSIRNGFTQLVVDKERDAVIGVHIVGPHASELIAEGVLAIEMAAAPGDIAGTIHAHPTLAEGLYEAAARYVHT